MVVLIFHIHFLAEILRHRLKCFPFLKFTQPVRAPRPPAKIAYPPATRPRATYNPTDRITAPIKRPRKPKEINPPMKGKLPTPSSGGGTLKSPFPSFVLRVFELSMLETANWTPGIIIISNFSCAHFQPLPKVSVI